MPYRVTFNKHAERQFRKLAKPLQARIAPDIRALADDPWPPGCRKLTGSRNYWRIRVADDYRIVYTIEDDLVLVTIVELDHRDSVYRRDYA